MAQVAINPANDEEIQRYEELDEAGIDGVLNETFGAWQEWRTTSFEQRSDLMNAAAGVLRANKERYARLMTDEMGKPISDSLGEVEKCAWVCEHYAEKAEGYLADDRRELGEGRMGWVVHAPLGPVLAIMPWNYPLWQVFRFAAPALMGGNAGILKHAPNVPGCGLAIEEVFREAGFPPVFRSVLCDVPPVAKMIADDRIRGVTLTGSERAGIAVGEQTGRALKPCVLELGGSDPFIVLEDADVARAAKVAAKSRFGNAGQTCIAAKRFVVVESIADQFTEALVEEASEFAPGDPSRPDTRMGPMARHDLRDAVVRQVDASRAEGAKVAIGGEIVGDKGCFYAPTVLTGVEASMTCAKEEIFGPAGAVLRAKDEADALRIANDTPFGLGASIWTGDKDRGCRMARAVDVGAVFINEHVQSDPRLPFGGTKRSGVGRELAEHGIRAFMNVKTIVAGA